MNSDEQLTEKDINDVPDNEIIDKEILEEDLRPLFGKELNTFIAHIASLSSTLQISMKAVSDAFKNAQQTMKEFEKDNITFKEIDGKKATLVKLESAQHFEDLNRQLRAYGLAFKTIPRSYIMALISQYDAFLGRLIRVVYLTKPQLLNTSDRNLTFSQLVEFASVEEAKEFILEKEIEGVLRKSHAEQFQWMETKFDMPLRKGLDSWTTFVEVTERRNLFVHTGGVVSSQYVKVCDEHKVDLGKISIGDELGVTREYFEKAYNVIFEIGFKLAHVFWRKFSPENVTEADENLISLGYDVLHEENYPLTKMIFDFATQTLKNKYSSDENRRIMIVNRALAYKWCGDDKKAKDFIAQEDWSATRARFRLAEATLMDDFESAYEIMKEIGVNVKEVSKKDYRDWPLFKSIKKEQNFLETFQEIFGEPYNKVEQIDSELPDKLSSGDVLANNDEPEQPAPQ